jgi:predicted DNA-binding transcriptional regulator AlpA
MQPKLLDTIRAAEYLGGLKPNTLEGWRVSGKSPRYIKIGRLVRYDVSDLDEYLAAQTRRSTSQV